MPKNVEVKAKIHDTDSMIKKAVDLCKTEAEIIKQSDTFFNTENGRLKLREFEGGLGELIFYERSNENGPKLSNYSKTMVTDPTSLKEVLTMALGVNGYVKKTRLLLHYKQTRIHIDEVLDLGSFLELEVVLDDDQTLEYGTKIAHEILGKLDIPVTDLICGSYLDCLKAN